MPYLHPDSVRQYREDWKAMEEALAQALEDNNELREEIVALRAELLRRVATLQVE